MDVTEDLVVKFHSLEGSSIGDRRKNLFLLLNTKHEEREKINYQAIVPQTTFEKFLHIDVLIYFRRTKELLQVLKSEEHALIVKVLNLRWFYEEAFAGVSGDQLVNDFFPNFSFSTKSRIISRFGLLLKDTKLADDYFAAIRAKYGLYLSSKLMQACSLELILNLTKSTRVEVGSTQLLNIIKKYPSATEALLENLNKYKTPQDFTVKYKLVFQHIALHDSKLFVRIFPLYELNFVLGRKTTTNILQADKDVVIGEAIKYIEILNKKQLARNLKDDFGKFYFNLFPKSIKDFTEAFEEPPQYGYTMPTYKKHNGSLMSMLKFLPVDSRADLFKNSFHRVYGDKIWDYPKFVNEKLMHILPIEEREKWANIKIDAKEDAPEKWISFLGIDKSIPLLKQTISVTNGVKKRKELLVCMVNTCEINKDEAALLDVCEYMVTRHRNEQFFVRNAFLLAVSKNFDIKKLDERYWKYFNELLQIIKVNKESYWNDNNYEFAWMYRKLLQNLPIKDEVKDLLKKDKCVCWDSFKKEPQFAKQYLLTVGEVIPETFKGDDLEQLSLSFLEALAQWNIHYPRDAISLFSYPKAMDHFIKVLGSDESYNCYYSTYKIIGYIIRLKCAEVETLKLRELYMANKKLCPDINYMIYLIRNYPEIVLRNIGTLFKHVFKNFRYTFKRSTFWRTFKYYTHLQMPQKGIEICLGRLDGKIEDEEDADENPETSQETALAVLSYLMDTNEFLELVKKYYPTDAKMDTTTEDGRLHYSKQKAIAPYLSNVSPAHLALEPILKFCKGDFLKLVQKPLYKIPHKVNENALSNFLDELASRGTSARKHGITLKCILGPKIETYKILNKSEDIEKNVTIRKHMCKLTLHYFTKNPDDQFWELLKYTLNAVETKDDELWDVLLDIKIVPLNYLPVYVAFVWEVLHEVADTRAFVQATKTTFLRLLTADLVLQLPASFCINLIGQYFHKTSELTEFQQEVLNFTCRYIVHAASTEALDAVFKIVKQQCVAECPDVKKEMDFRKYLSTFCNKFCDECMEHKNASDVILSKFTQHWDALFKPENAFKEYLYQHFSSLHLEFVKSHAAIVEIGKKIANDCDALLDTYGCAVIVVLYDVLKSFLVRFLKDEVHFNNENLYAFIDALQKNSKSSNCTVLAIYLISNNIPEHPTTSAVMAKYYEIMSALKKVDDRVVKIHLNSLV